MSIKWKSKEVEALKKLYPLFIKGTITEQELTSVLGRTYSGIKTKAYQLHLTVDTTTMDVTAYKKICKRLKI